MQIAQEVDLFPDLPRNTVFEGARDIYNRFRRDHERLGGLMPIPMAAFLLEVSQQRVHELVKVGKLASCRYGDTIFVSGSDVVERLEAPKSRGGRPRKNSLK